MAVMKCKICGGDLVLEPGAAIAVCEYCGTRQTVPREKPEKNTALSGPVPGAEEGQRALDSREWERAEEIFDRILEDDPDNAEACIGKVLAQEKYKTLADLVTGRLAATEEICPHPMTLAAREDHILESVRAYTVPGYLESEEIREQYDCNRCYPSYAFERQKQLLTEEKWWKNKELLIRAEVTARGDLAAMLQGQKQRLFAELKKRLEAAREEDDRTIRDFDKAYDAAVREGDRQAQDLFQAALARREKDYQLLVRQIKKEKDPAVLRRLADQLDRLGDYKESKKYLELCRQPRKEATPLGTVLFYAIMVLLGYLMFKLGLL